MTESRYLPAADRRHARPEPRRLLGVSERGWVALFIVFFVTPAWLWALAQFLNWVATSVF